MTDAVNHPSHYLYGEHEAIELTRGLSFCAGNAVKYILRADRKNEAEDLRKAVWYLFALEETSALEGNFSERLTEFFAHELEKKGLRLRAHALRNLRTALTEPGHRIHTLRVVGDMLRDEIEAIERSQA